MAIQTRLPDNIGSATDTRIFFASESGQQWISDLAKNTYFRRYESDYRNLLNLKQCNDIAGQFIGEHYGIGQPFSAADAIPQNEPFDCWQYEMIPELKSIFQERDIQVDEIEDALRPEWEAAINDHDFSKPTDAFSQHDRCELLFMFQDTQYVLDGLCQSQGNWPDFSKMCIDANLQHSLNQLGHTLGEYRKYAKNDGQGIDTKPGKRPNRKSVISLDDIAEIVENACSTRFAFVVYGIVEIRALLSIDLDKTVEFKKAHIAVYDPINGTFHDHGKPVDIAVAPHQGRYISGSDYYSPDNICGFIHSYYQAEIANAPHELKGEGERVL